ncbi:MAG: hypothetical protein JHC93_01515 [Parachlamydiales bacterium]|nr:hypothetical protein [Parachlamydiales bacterium]
MNIYTDEEFNHLINNLSNQDQSVVEDGASQQEKQRLRHKKEQMQMASILKRTVIELKKAKCHVNELQSEIHAKKEQHSSLDSQLQLAQNEIQRLKNTDRILNENVTYYSKDQGSVPQEALKKALIDLKTARQKLQNLNKEISDARRDQQDLTKAKDNALARVKELELIYEQTKSKTDLQHQKIAHLEAEKRLLKRSQEDLETMRLRQTQMAESLKKALDQVKEQTILCENLDYQLQQAKRHEADLAEDNVHLKMLVEETKHTLQNLRLQENVAKTDIASYEIKNNELVKEVTTLKELIEQTQSHFLEKQAQLEDLQKEYSSLEIEYRHSKQSLEAFEKEIQQTHSNASKNEFVEKLNQAQHHNEILRHEKEHGLYLLREQAEELKSKEKMVVDLQRTLQEEKQLKDSACQMLQQQKLDAENELVLWHERLMQEKHVSIEIEQTLKSKENLIDQLQKTLQDLDLARQETFAECCAKEDLLSKHQEAYKASLLERQRLQETVNEKDKQLLVLQAAYEDAKKTEIAHEQEMHNRRIALENEVIAIKKKLIDAEKIKETMRQDWEQFRLDKERETSSLYEKLAATQREHLTLSYETERQMSDKDALLSALQQKVQDADRTISSLDARLKSEHHELHAQLLEWQEKFEYSEQQLVTVQNDLKQQLEEKGQEIAALNHGVIELEDEKNSALHQLEVLRLETRSEIFSLSERLKEAHAFKEELNREFEEKQIIYKSEIDFLKYQIEEISDVNAVLLEELQYKIAEKAEDAALYSQLMASESRDKDKWQEAWEKAKCELSKAREERTLLDEEVFLAQQQIAQLEDEKVAFSIKEKEWQENSKNFEVLWKQHQDKTRQNLEVKDREIVHLKQTFKTALDQSQQRAAQAIALQEKEFLAESAKLKDILQKSMQIEEKQSGLIAKLQDEVRTGWLQVQELQEEVEEKNRATADKDVEISERIQENLNSKAIIEEQNMALASFKEELSEHRSKTKSLQDLIDQEKEQSQKLQHLANEKLHWYEDQMKQSQERYLALQTQLQESQAQMVTLERAKTEYEAFMNNFKSFVNKTMPEPAPIQSNAPLMSQQLSPKSLPESLVASVPQPVMAHSQEELVMDTTPKLEASLPFGSNFPYLGQKQKSDLFDTAG